MVQRIKILQPFAHRVEQTNLNTSVVIVAQYLRKAISDPNVALRQGQKQKNVLTAEQNTFRTLIRTVAIPTKLVILPLYMRIQPPNLSKREKLDFGFWAGFSLSLSHLQF